MFKFLKLINLGIGMISLGNFNFRSLIESSKLHGFRVTDLEEAIWSRLDDKDSKQPQCETLFKVTSFFYNIERNAREPLNCFTCLLSKELEAFCVIIDREFICADLTKEAILSFLQFSRDAKIFRVAFLLDRRNPNYGMLNYLVKLLQGLMTVGFKTRSDIKILIHNEIQYKVLEMNVDSRDSFEELMD